MIPPQLTLPKLGDVLAEKYRVDAIIGEGGFALVFQATDLTVDRAVALKVLKPSSNGYEVTLTSRFVREARVLAELTDAHTIRMFDFGRAPDGLLFMVFELLPGDDLADLLARGKRFSEDEVVHVMRQLLSSLREAHARGMLHRDIKPQNVRIYEYMGDPLRAKLMDFGIARQMGPDAVSLTKTGDLVGTLAYMAPEQATGVGLTPSTDLYCLGLLAFEMLTGESRSARSATAAGRTVDVPASGLLASVITALLQVKQSDRPQNVDDVLAALNGEITLTRTPTRPAPARPKIEDEVATIEAAGDTIRDPVTGERGGQRVAIGGWVVLAILAVLAVTGAGLALVRQSADTDESPNARSQALRQLTKSARPSEPIVVDEAKSDVDLPRDAGTPEPVLACAQSDVKPGLEQLSFRDGLESHRWSRWVPRRYDPKSPPPLLILFHTDFDTPLHSMKAMHLMRFANEHNLVILAPYGDGPETVGAWVNYQDSFITRGMLAALKSEVCIDENRIFVLGHGSGGLPTEAVSCEPWVRGVITTSHRSNVGARVCPDVPRATLFFSPSTSGHLPIEGGSNCSQTRKLISLERQEQQLRKRNRCKSKVRVAEAPGAKCFEWQGCEEPFVSCHIEGGHQWPGMKKRKVDLLGCDGTPPDYDYLAPIWTFIDGLR